MAKIDYLKVNNTLRFIQNVAYLTELPVATENSADLVSVNNELYVKQVNGTTYTYAKVGGSGLEIINAETEFTVSNIQTDAYGNPTLIEGNIPEKYRDVERLSKAIVRVGGQLFRCEEVSDYNMKFASISPFLEDEGGTIYTLYYVEVNTQTWNFDWSKYTFYNKGSGGVALIEKTIDTESQPLAFTEDFTQEEFDKLLSGALLQVWTMPNTLSYVLKPYVIQTQASANAYGVRLSALTDIETGNYLCIDVIQRNGIFETRINNVATASGGTEVIERTIIEKGSDYLVFAEQLTQEEFDTIANNDNVIIAVKNSEGLTFYLNKILNANLSNENVNQFVFMGLFNDDQYGVAFMSINGELITQGMYNKIGASEPTVINLNTYVPSTATNGTLDSSVLATLQASDSNYIVFNNEIFKLADKQHNEGYLVYSHNGHDTTGCFFQKCITITLSTRGWVLETQENASKTYVDNAIGTALQGDY